MKSHDVVVVVEDVDEKARTCTNPLTCGNFLVAGDGTGHGLHLPDGQPV